MPRTIVLGQLINAFNEAYGRDYSELHIRTANKVYVRDSGGKIRVLDESSICDEDGCMEYPEEYQMPEIEPHTKHEEDIINAYSALIEKRNKEDRDEAENTYQATTICFRVFDQTPGIVNHKRSRREYEESDEELETEASSEEEDCCSSSEDEEPSHKDKDEDIFLCKFQVALRAKGGVLQACDVDTLSENTFLVTTENE